MKRITNIYKNFMRLFCFIGLHSYKTTDTTVNTFVIKEYCKCKRCGKEAVFIGENDSI